jgi:hypothetical protein
MSIRTDLSTESLLSQFRAQKSAGRKAEGRPAANANSQTARTDVHLQAKISAAGLAGTAAGSDSVEISLTAGMTAHAANGIVMDSVVEQINKAIQEAGIDLTIEDAKASGMDLSPEATARRIADFSTGFLDSYISAHGNDPARVRISGFMSLIRGAIEEGFLQARDFMEGITKLSETIDRNIDKTFELTSQYLDEFHQVQIERVNAAAEAPVEGKSQEAATSPEVID